MKKRKKLIAIGLMILAVTLGVGGYLWMTKPWISMDDVSEQGDTGTSEPEDIETDEIDEVVDVDEPEDDLKDEPVPTASGLAYAAQNYTLGYGRLMLINPIFTVGTDFIAARRGELVDMTAEYGIIEGVAGNGRPMLDPEAAPYLAEMVADYRAAYPGHDLETRSCFRAVGTSCGRLCYATGTSDHHTGYTCDLIDPAYGTELDTDLLAYHPEWQWLKENSWKYGFIDRFPEEWAGGPMSEPINMTADGSTGVYEVWHYRYVGSVAAREIAEGKYNNGRYDSLEHYLKATGRIENLLAK